MGSGRWWRKLARMWWTAGLPSGPSKHQAAAPRIGADLSAFYCCSFMGHQDTLYVHSLHQFFRDCSVYDTMDFIFGDAVVVLQNYNLYTRKSDPNQKNIFMAQGREDPDQNTGISIQECKVATASDLILVQSNFSAYLGWLAWDGGFALSTLFYGEYMSKDFINRL